MTMMAWHNRKALFYFALAAGLLILLAVGLPESFRPAILIEGSVANPRPLIGSLSEREAGDFTWLAYMFVAVYMLGLLAILLTAEGRKRFLILAGMAGLLLLALYLSSPRQPAQVENLGNLPTPVGVEAVQSLPTVPAQFIATGDPPVLPDWVVVVIVILLALVLAGTLAMLFMAFSGRLRRPASLPEQISIQVQAALDELEAGQDYPDVVMRCYARMSQVLKEARGLSREQSMTPHEFETSLIQYGFPETPVRNLTHLFEDVRYGSLTVDERGISLAVESLSAIVAYCQQEKAGGES